MNFGRVFIVSGPAGVGKTTVCGRLLAANAESLRRIVTVTTRPPRPEEREGIDYFFIDEPAFLRYIAEDKFLEYANVHRRYFYGTPIGAVFSNLRRGIDSLLIVDVQGMRQVRKRLQGLGCVTTIFLMPEHLGVLEERLQRRNSEKEEDIRARLRSAEMEIRCAQEYDYVIVSGTRDEDFWSMQQVYSGEHSRFRIAVRPYTTEKWLQLTAL
ncbi:MAG: guanylate kinase [Opitutales bacterium]|nr:guanylate kinase [Opitutales bacterium]